MSIFAQAARTEHPQPPAVTPGPLSPPEPSPPVATRRAPRVGDIVLFNEKYITRHGNRVGIPKPEDAARYGWRSWPAVVVAVAQPESPTSEVGLTAWTSEPNRISEYHRRVWCADAPPDPNG